jgi:ubiquitin-conjugating enzyme E2 D/E
MLLINKRLQKDIDIIYENSLGGVVVKLNGDNLKDWTVILHGPENTPYVGGKFKLKITFPDEYPYVPPNVIFDTPIIHPNISIDGKVCINILSNDWHAGITMHKVLLAINSLMISPNLNDPLVPNVANMYLTDYDKFISTAKKHAEKHAM